MVRGLIVVVDVYVVFVVKPEEGLFGTPGSVTVIVPEPCCATGLGDMVG